MVGAKRFVLCLCGMMLLSALGAEKTPAQQYINYTFTDVDEHLMETFEVSSSTCVPNCDPLECQILNDSGEMWIGFRLRMEGLGPYGPYCCENMALYSGPGFGFLMDVDGGPSGYNELLRISFFISPITDGNYLIFDIWEMSSCYGPSCMYKRDVYGDPVVLRLIRFTAFNLLEHLVGRFSREAMFLPGQPFAIINETGEAWREYHLALIGTDTEDAPFPFVAFTDVDEDQVIYRGPGTPALMNLDGIDGPERLIIRELNILPGDTLFFRADISGYPPSGLDSLDIMGYPLPHITDDAIEEVANSCHLYQNQPNPFNPVTHISFYIPENTRVRLEIFDVRGRLVKSLCNRTYDKGQYKILWDGIDDSGTPAESGVYFYKLTTGKETRFKKMVLLR